MWRGKVNATFYWEISKGDIQWIPGMWVSQKRKSWVGRIGNSWKKNQPWDNASPIHLPLMNNKGSHWLHSKSHFHNLLLFLLTSVYLSTTNEKKFRYLMYNRVQSQVAEHKKTLISHIHMGTFKIKFPNDCFFNILKTHFTTS